MEPCAPGTEDDLPIMYSTLNKQENEKERLLKQKAILRNGKYDNIFELSYVNGSEHWFCKACECPVMGRVFQHEIGKRHTQNIANNNRHMERRQKEETRDEPEVMDIAPGEPAPPGFEEISRTSQIQDKLEGFKAGPLVALEYLLELQDYDPSKEPIYLCILCDKRGDPRTVLTHLASYNHITHYLQKHFPTCYRALAPYMVKQYKRNWQITLQKIAEGIEKKFGRLRPYPIEKDKFENDKLPYFQLIAKGRHFSELSGYTFEELVVPEELKKVHEDEKGGESSITKNWGASSFIEKPFKKRSPSPPVVAMPSKKNKSNQPTTVQKPKVQQSRVPVQSSTHSTKPVRQSPVKGRRRSLSSVSSISSDDLHEVGNKNSRQSSNKDKRRNRSPVARGRQLPYMRNRSPSPRRRSPTPPPIRRNERPRGADRERNDRERSDSSRSREQQDEKLRKIEEFRKLARAIENDMHKTLKQHEKNPEKHPQYSEEWKKFWNMRYKQLQSQGVDVAKYDFKPEWIEFWNKRMIELHSDELRTRKDALRKRLGLPEEINPIKFSIGSTGGPGAQIVVSAKPNLPMAAQPDQDNEVIIIEDREEDRHRRKRSRSPWEKESSPKSRLSKKRSSPSPASRGRTRERSAPKRRSPSRERSREYYHVKSKSPSPRESSRSRDGPSDRYTRDISRSKEHERDDRSFSRERRSPSLERLRERREYERKRIEYRESSFERDLKAKERVRTVADLPWEREKHYRNMYSDYYQPPSLMRDVSRTPQMHSDMRSLPPDEEEDNLEVNVVDVLRILTALEERLGSLGPKVVDLLAQALALEKKDANSSETLLDNDINCVLFETIKEKLKGQLLTGLVDVIQERAFKKAIKKIASLLHLAGQRKKHKEKVTPKVTAVSVPGVGTVDRAAIAKQIANALIAQGKTDVTQSELEQLINAVVGMAEASKNSNKPVTTANFLQQLTGGLAATSETSNSQDDKAPVRKGNEDLGKLVEPLTPSPGKNSIKDMENLSDTDLQTLLQNFKDLSNEEQHNLINYLKKLEYQEPERVEKLRSFVNLETGSKAKEVENPDKKVILDRESPFSNRLGSLNPASEDLVQIESEDDMDNENLSENNEEPESKIRDESEDEDYTYEDVVKTASKNVKEKEKEIDKKKEEDSIKKKEVDLANAKDLISNLMSNISKRNDSSKGIDLLGLGPTDTSLSSSASILPNIQASTAEFAKTLSSISMDSLANIVSTVKNMTSVENAEKNMSFETPPENPMSFEPSTSISRLNFDPAQLDKPNLDTTGMSLGRSDHYDRSFPPRGQSFDRTLGSESTFRNLGPEPQLGRSLGPVPGADSLLGRGPEVPFRDESSTFMDRGGPLSRMSMPRGSNTLGNLPPPFGNRDGAGPRGPNPHFAGSSLGMRERPTAPYSSRTPFNNFQPQLNQYSNTVRGPRLNLLDRNRLGSSNDFNNRNNFNRW